MKRQNIVKSALLLLALSALIYLLQILIFRDFRNMAFYALQDWAFLPVQVVLVTIVAGDIISRWERENRIEKTRMFTGTFFGDLGCGLLAEISPAVTAPSDLASMLNISSSWRSADFEKAAAGLRTAEIRVSCGPERLVRLRDLLSGSKTPMLIIASNPVLLEHERFTDMLWAIFHLADELELRSDLMNLTPGDAAHINSDVERVLGALLVNWIRHLDYLRTQYPYLFLLEVGRNPFSKN